MMTTYCQRRIFANISCDIVISQILRLHTAEAQQPSDSDPHRCCCHESTPRKPCTGATHQNQHSAALPPSLLGTALAERGGPVLSRDRHSPPWLFSTLAGAGDQDIANAWVRVRMGGQELVSLGWHSVVESFIPNCHQLSFRRPLQATSQPSRTAKLGLLQRSYALLQGPGNHRCC